MRGHGQIGGVGEPLPSSSLSPSGRPPVRTNIELVCGEGALPRIQELEVAGIKVGTEVVLQGNMPLLERVTYHLDCKGCGPAKVHEAEEKLKAASEAHPNHPALSIKRFNNVWLEMTHLMTSIYPEVVKAIEAQGPCDAGSELQSCLNFVVGSTPLVDRCMKALVQCAENCGAPPTLAVGEAGTGSPSQVIKISTHGISESIALQTGIDYDKLPIEMEMLRQIPEVHAAMKSVVRNADGSLPTSELTGWLQAMVSALSSQVEQNAGVLGSGEAISPNPTMATESLLAEACRTIADNELPGEAGMDPAYCMNLMQKFMQNPKFFECYKTLMQNPEFVFDVMKAYMPGGLNFAVQKTDGPGKTSEAGKQPTEDSGAGLRHDSQPEVQDDSVLNALDGAAFSSERLLGKHEQKPMMPSSLTPGYTSGGGQTDASSMLSGLLSNPAFASLMAGITAQVSSMDVAESSSASVAPNVGVAPGSSQDGEKELLPAVQQTLAAGTSSGQPSLKPGNVEEKAPARE